VKAGAKALILTAVLLGGCRATRDVAVTSYHVTRGVAVGSYRVATAPVHLIRGHSDDPPQTTTTTHSDVAAPGYPVSATSEVSSQAPQEPPPPQQRVASSNTPATTTPSEHATTKPKPPRTTAAQPQFPTAKPVPGRAGLVYNPYDPNGGYIDVSGYPSGSKVKDPDSQKIFIVP